LNRSGATAPHQLSRPHPARPADPLAPAQPPATGEYAAPSGLPAPWVVPGGWPRDLELVRRTDGQRRFIMLINHGTAPATVQLPSRTVTVQVGDVEVITE
jgi:hypothetical protein